MFGALAEAIRPQQLSTKAAATIYARLCANLTDRQGRLHHRRAHTEPGRAARPAMGTVPETASWYLWHTVEEVL